MATKKPDKRHRARKDEQVFYEFPGAIPLGLTVTELPALPASWWGGVTTARVSFWITRAMLLFAAFLLFLTLVGTAVLTAYYFTSPAVPPLSALVNKQFHGATIYDRNGQVLFNLGYGATHQTAQLKDIPPYFIQATIAAEDENFYHHHGIDLAGITRAALADVQHKQTVQGGSTITQQLVKNTILNDQKSFDRKLKEAVMAAKVEHTYTKDQILDIYLNQIFYGQHSWGVADATHNYFDEPVSKLTLAQSAMLAGIPNAPTAYSPLGGSPDLAISRQHYVLDRMQALGYITPAQKQAAEAEQLTYHPTPDEIKAPHFVAYVRDLLSRTYSEQQMEEDGFKVYTTLDLTDQERAQRLVTTQVHNLAGQNVTNGSLVAIDPKNGQILAMVGSADWSNDAIGGKYNDALANRQPGSALKPLTYTLGFSKGITASTILHDKPTDFGGGYKPTDYDRKYRGNIPARTALQNSLNIPAVEVLRYDTIPSFVDFAHKLGITTLNGSLSDYGLALTLGGGEVKLLDLTSAYGVFANQGVRMEPQAILKVEDSSGKVLVDNTHSPSGTNVISPQLAYYISNVLSDNNARAMEFGLHSSLYLGDRPAAAKTGTTDDFRDAWTFGYTPDLVVGAWVGNNNNAPMGQIAGALGAAPIWHDFMEQTLAGTPVHPFAQPAGISTRCVNTATGLPTEQNPATCSAKDIFIDGINPVVLPDTSIKQAPKPAEPSKPQDNQPAPGDNKPQPQPQQLTPQPPPGQEKKSSGSQPAPSG